MTYAAFRFDSYNFDVKTKTLNCHYSIDSTLHFTESYTFELETLHNTHAIAPLCQLVFLTAGVSYYKTYLPSTIEYGDDIYVDSELSEYLQLVYEEGLGEFFYVNGLDPYSKINFPINKSRYVAQDLATQGPLIGVGGGKDSIVSIEALRNITPATWSVGHKEQLSPLVKILGTQHTFVTRKIDAQLVDKKLPDAYSGHVPISAVFASVGCLLAALSNRRDVIVSNESSANESTLNYRGKEINHQFSKSLLFEKEFQKILRLYFGDSLRYFSYVRNLDELQISQNFANYFTKYSAVFSSCNKAFRQNNNRLYWCESCPKCAFVYLALSVFIDESELKTVFSENLILKSNLEPIYKMLLGMSDGKPLECVGTIDECRWAMGKNSVQYPILTKKYVLTNNYKLGVRESHAIPADYTPL